MAKRGNKESTPLQRITVSRAFNIQRTEPSRCVAKCDVEMMNKPAELPEEFIGTPLEYKNSHKYKDYQRSQMSQVRIPKSFIIKTSYSFQWRNISEVTPETFTSFILQVVYHLSLRHWTRVNDVTCLNMTPE